jgi:hypothetical protein
MRDQRTTLAHNSVDITWLNLAHRRVPSWQDCLPFPMPTAAPSLPGGKDRPAQHASVSHIFPFPRKQNASLPVSRRQILDAADELYGIAFPRMEDGRILSPAPRVCAVARPRLVLEATGTRRVWNGVEWLGSQRMPTTCLSMPQVSLGSLVFSCACLSSGDTASSARRTRRTSLASPPRGNLDLSPRALPDAARGLG